MIKHISWLFVLLMAACGANSGTSLFSGSRIKPTGKVEHFSFDFFSEDKNQKTKHILYTQTKDGYSLKDRLSGIQICKDTFYCKTFGGSFPHVTVHVLDDRFIVYPETLRDSNVANTTFNDMKAVTHVYDMKYRIHLSKSKAYQYNHNVPLKYNYSTVTSLGWFKNLAQQGGASDR